jgi:hypothetical protein
MVKDEADIVRDWVLYHTSLVGQQNIYAVDNMSTDGTYEILRELKVNTFRSSDYKKKGYYMTNFADKFPNDIIIPLDIDEFIVRYNSDGTISCDGIAQRILHLPLKAVYKMNYVQVQCSKDFAHATLQAEKGVFEDYGALAKSFFNTRVFKGKIDHGNHFYTKDYILSPFVLVHYQTRNREQILRKIKNNLVGLGYDLTNKEQLQHVVQNRREGNHHARSWLQIMDGEPPIRYSSDGNVDLRPLALKILQLTARSNILGVVARYNESLDWMLESPFNQLKYVVYNKGPNESFCKTNVVKVVTLPNVGRCDHTYLFHLVHNYHKMEQVVCFLPGSIDIDFKKDKAARIVKHAIQHVRPAFVVNERADIRSKFADFFLDEWQCIHKDNAASNSERKLTPCALRPFGKWYDIHFGNTKTNFYGLHGIFSVSPSMVQRRKLYEYMSLLNEVSVSSNPEVGHYLERAWAAIFGSAFDFV